MIKIAIGILFGAACGFVGFNLGQVDIRRNAGVVVWTPKDRPGGLVHMGECVQVGDIYRTDRYPDLACAVDIRRIQP